jgi:predicted nucleic acid-binding protein
MSESALIEAGVLVDTPIWSLALRRKAHNLSQSERLIVGQFSDLITAGQARIIGPVRQELLSGIPDKAVFERLRGHLRSFDEPSLGASDYEEAARMNNACRVRGIAGSPADFLICAAAVRRNWAVFTPDADFKRYATVARVKLFSPG